MAITFRRLAEADLPTLHRWLNEPGIVRWWEGDDVSWEGVLRDYQVTHEDGTEHWIVVRDGVDVGWIQYWIVAAEPEATASWLAAGVHPTAGGIDYFIAEPGQRDAGLGSTMIRQFTDEVVFGLHPDCTQCAVTVDLANPRSWRALEKAGYRRIAMVEDDEPLYVKDRGDA